MKDHSDLFGPSTYDILMPQTTIIDGFRDLPLSNESDHHSAALIVHSGASTELPSIKTFYTADAQTDLLTFFFCGYCLRGT